MTRILLRTVAAALIISITAQAQTRVGLAHGILSSGSTWSDLTVDLLTDGFSVPTPPNLPWTTYIASQANNTFTPFLSSNGFGSTSLIAGHSQGGLVARFTSQNFAVKGTVTVGTPNAGAPIASQTAAANLLAYTSLIYYADEVIFYGFSDVRESSGHYLYSLVRSLDDWEFGAVYGFVAWLAYAYAVVNFLELPVSFTDMAPPGWSGSSGFVSNLNSNLVSEQATYKLAVRMELDGGYYGGPARLAMGASASDVFGIGVIAYGAYLLYQGFGILSALELSDPNYFAHEFSAWTAVAMGDNVAYLPYLWHFDLVGGVPNDGIVPKERQSVSGQEAINASGYSHLEETNIGRAVIRTWINDLRSR